MKLSSWCLLAASAILYAVPFIFPFYAWWIGFIFPIPLFYVAMREDLGFLHGAIWSIVAMSAHLSGVFLSIDGFASTGAGLERALPAAALLSYAGLTGGIWFWFTRLVRRLGNLTSPFAIIALWTCTLWCYMFFLDRLCLWPFDLMEGYFAFHPLLPLATHPQLFMLMPIIGKNLLALLMYLVPATITLFLVQHNLRNALFVFCALLPWCISLFIPMPKANRPAWLDKIMVLPASFPVMGNSTNQAEAALSYFQRIKFNYPQTEIIILPESAFHCDHLSTEPTLCDLWSRDYVGKPMHVLLGAFRWDGPNFHNSLHWVYDGKIKNIFDKRHAMILIERVPSKFNSTVIRELFFKTFPEIIPARTARPRFEISEDIAFIPYICSELFFNEFPDDSYPTTPILSVTNDRWCINLYVADLMYLDARLKAILWQRDILYVSFKYAVYIDRWGNETPLNRMTA